MLLAACLAGAARHDFHVSITTIHHNAGSRSLEVTVKVFTDDLERSLKALGAPELRLGDPAREAPEADALIDRYLQNRLQIAVDGQPASLRWLGKEVELDATWCYLEIDCPSQPRALAITNRILTETFDDQSNVAHIEVAGARKSILFHTGGLTGEASF